MNTPIIALTNAKKGMISLPEQFHEPVRLDLIRRAVTAIESKSRQAYGAAPGAGQRQSAKLSRRRRDYKAAYGMGISRVPRKTLNRNGSKMYWVGAVAPGTVKGRRAHPPKAYKQWAKKINDKENKKAIRSAISATIDKDIVASRGHKVPEQYPLIIESSAEQISKTKELQKVLTLIGLEADLERSSNKRQRAGRGKMRGRKYKQPIGLLIVTAGICGLSHAGENLPGVNVVPVNSLNAKVLAPGGHPGRLTLFTQSAVEKMKNERLYC